MNFHSSRVNFRGFSLIEVLVAVVVLSFGLLALAALQTRLIQASADAKAQSVGLALAKDKLEELRSFKSIASDCVANPDSYRCINSNATAETINDSGGNLGGVNYTRNWTVRRYAVATGATNFTQLAAGANTGALPSGYVENNEFKTVDVRVTWTDASGQSRSIALEDAIAGLDPQDTARNQRNRPNRPRGPQVNIFNPAGEAGVIPIAIGNGSDTAATNPKPVVVGRNNGQNSQAVVETRFDVLTYAGISGTDNALAQSRVETTIVGCKCNTANAPGGTAKAYRPVYWNGFRYAPPKVATYAPPAGAATIGNGDPPQSRYCDACCRNHHDPSTVASTEARFDRRRGTTNGHLHFNLVNGQLVAGGGEYIESCRLIRTDGIFDVAADLYNDHFNLLETKSLAFGNTTEPAPSTLGVASYQDFVKDYLGQRFVGGSVNTFNTAETTPTRAELNDQTSPQSLDKPESPDQPTLQRTADARWLHARGLYVDHLEKEARDAVADAKSECTDQTAQGLLTCVLKVLPFTSINLTELATWATSATVQMTVTNNGFIDALFNDNPVRGKAESGSDPQNGALPIATATIRESNSGLALYPAVDDEDAVAPTPDTQEFRIGAGAPPPGSGGNFAVTLAGALPAIIGGGKLPDVAFSTSAQSGVTCNPVTVGTSGYPNPYTCTATALGSSVSVLVTDYNFQAEQAFSGSVTCTKSNGSATASLTISRNDRPFCRNFAVTAASNGGIPGTVVNQGRSTESTPVVFPAVSATTPVTNLTLTFSDESTALPATPDPTEYTCTYNGNAPAVSDFQWNGCQ